MKARRFRWLLAAAALAALLAGVSPWLPGLYWQYRSDNPVRRGLRKANELGCFHCHGDLGSAGIPDPAGADNDVPAWSGGVWMMYVKDESEIRKLILDGSAGLHHEQDGEEDAGDEQAIAMPAYGDLLGGSDLDDLVAIFKIASRMNVPPADSDARKGYDLARRWRCFSCHGPGGSGGLPNPRSFTGYIPGWYGADFADLVRTRGEFDAWITKGVTPRLQSSSLASFFTRRQRIEMPEYSAMKTGDLDALWAYTRWLEETGGGLRGVQPAW